MHIPNDRRYATTHEWIKAEGDVMLVGISAPAQDQLGDLVFVGDVNVGGKLSAGAVAGIVESVKAASDIHAPVTGQVIAFNDALNDNPGLINEDPYETWIFKIKPDQPKDIDGYLDASAYETIAQD